jgi:hypothetical protein
LTLLRCILAPSQACVNPTLVCVDPTQLADEAFCAADFVRTLLKNETEKVRPMSPLINVCVHL